jgi:glycosyltransferase involved in cell wall biosynthesis
VWLDRMNVLHVIHYPIFGGPHNQSVLLASVLKRFGVRTIILMPDEPGNALERLREMNVDVVTMPLHRVRATLNPRKQFGLAANLPKEVRGIRHVIRSERIDVVQIGGLVNPHGAIAAHLAGAAVVWQLLDTRAPHALRWLMMPLVARMADVVMTTGAAVARAHPGVDRLGDRASVFFPPVDAAAFRCDVVDREGAREQYGLKGSDVVIGTVANLNPQKGHEYLIRAAAAVRKDVTGTKLLIVGSSYETHRAYEQSLYRLVERLDLSVGRDVIFAGGLSDVRPALAAMDAFVLSSVPRSEGAPTAVEEAMMMGLPVVATDVGAVTEVVDDGVTGYVVPPRNSEAIAEAVVNILRDRTRRKRFGDRGRERAVAKFSVEECARVHLTAYKLARAHRANPSRERANPPLRRGSIRQ